MSRNIKNSTPIQKYCKVCHDAGKSEAEYRSHFTRESPDPKSKVLCPTLLALECRYCFKNGHTVKYCSVLKENEKKKKNEEVSARRVEKAKADVKTKGKSNTNHNAFACLDSDSEEDEEAVNPQEEFPVLSTAICRSEPVSFNYAAALTRPAAPKVAPKVEEVLKVQEVVAPAAKVQVAKVQAAKVAPWASKTATATSKSWAAWDSESEDDEDDEFDDTPCCWDNQTVERDDFLDDETW